MSKEITTLARFGHRSRFGDGKSGAEHSFPQYVGKEVIYIEWTTGGVSGGSCWDSSNPQPYTSSETEPHFEELDDLLQELRPNLTFLEFRRLESKCIHSYTYSVTEYYGNSTNYAIKFVVLDELKEFIAGLP